LVFRRAQIESGCRQRADALAGTWWRMECPTVEDNCLGPVDAGTYKSQFIAQHVAQGGEWEAVCGALTYTVPDGWANASDWPESFELVPASEMPPIDDADRTGVIAIFHDPTATPPRRPRLYHTSRPPTAMTQDRPCSDQVESGVGRTADELATWIGTVP